MYYSDYAIANVDPYGKNYKKWTTTNKEENDEHKVL